MDIQSLFGAFPLARFIDEHLHRLPLALPDVCDSVCHLGTWQLLDRLLGAVDADVMVVRNGARYEGAVPSEGDAARRLCADGCTILVRHAERHNAEIEVLAQAFCGTFRAPVNVHMYATPPGSFGFSWHYDAEDVFILQTTGEKEYFLRKNTVNPWPLEETIPLDMLYEREIMPAMRVVLRAGDLLYIPCGYWHRGQVTECEETAISLAVGVMSRSAMDVYELLKHELLQSLVWRQRLPVIHGVTDCEPEPRMREAFQHLFKQLADDARRTIASAAFQDRVIAQFAPGDAKR